MLLSRLYPEEMAATLQATQVLPVATPVRAMAGAEAAAPEPDTVFFLQLTM